MSDMAVTFLILGLVVILFVWNKLPVEIVGIGAALALATTGVLTVEQSIAGFGDTTVMFIATLFVVSEGLEASGVTTWAGQHLVARAGDSRTRLLVFTMALVAALTALISVNGAVAALLPMVVVVAVRLGQSPSQLLMPLAFAAHAGSLLALTGTPVNILVSDAAADAGQGAFGFFSFTLVGLPLIVGVIAITAVFGRRLLPDRPARVLSPDLSDHARTLAQQYRLPATLTRLHVLQESTVAGLVPGAVDLSGHPDVHLIGVQAAPGRANLTDPIAVGQLLVVGGSPAAVEAFSAATGTTVAGEVDMEAADSSLLDRDSGVAEIVIPPRSGMVGSEVFPGMVTSSGDLVVLAVQRRGVDRGPGPTRLAVGDTLLVQGDWDALDRHIAADADILVVDAPAAVRRQAVPLGRHAKEAIVILVGMVLLLATGIVPAVVASLLAAAAMILMRVVTMAEAYRSVSWTTVVLVGSMIPLSAAITSTGAADEIADGLIGVIGDAGPYALLAGLFVLTATMGQLISNMATALVVIPIAVTAAAELGVSARPVLMSLTVAAAASFLTPVATPANLMVMGPGGYRFGDYWKLGLPLLLWFFVIAVFLVPVFWPF